jgi:transposase
LVVATKLLAIVGVSLGTVSNIGKMECSGRNLSKGGRPRAPSKADERYCVCLATKGRMDNAIKIKKQLQVDYSIKVSADTIRRVLRKEGLGAIEKKGSLY